MEFLAAKVMRQVSGGAGGGGAAAAARIRVRSSGRLMSLLPFPAACCPLTEGNRSSPRCAQPGSSPSAESRPIASKATPL
ncbi:hypothetical protein E2C01_014867 [Portunus trituberculatus]|uniref:Uncharacterized protein n=1 Tax=Portunus trituberculatus TaxID=210409 RepID=A0A5B7DLF1_PORTR|nr:hypothetical protein [Portunus trituberculatus]